MKNKHRIKQGLSLLLAGGIALTNLGAALPAFAEDAAATPETAEAATPETAEADTTAPNLVADYRESLRRSAGRAYRQLPWQHGSARGNRRDKNRYLRVGF